MLRYAVVEIAGRQYKVRPGQQVKVNYLGDIKSLSCDKVLATASENKLELGFPYLKSSLDFEVLGSGKAPKIRVAKYSAKANTHRVVGSRADYSTVKLKES